MHDGLTEAMARKRLLEEGPNELPSDARASLLRSLVVVLKEPMIGLLLVASALYLALGEPHDAFALLGCVLAVIGMTLYQRRKTEHALHALAQLSAPVARVLRDGHERSLPSREIVRGDSVVLREGDRVPADGIVLDCTSLRIDESLLTGESVHVDKDVGDEAAPLGAPGDAPYAVFASTLVVRGYGVARVRATGPRTAVGAIGRALRDVVPMRGGLRLEVSRAVTRIAFVALALCVVVFVAHGLMGLGWLRGLLAGITLAMALLPEEIPVVLSVFTLLGAARIAKLGVLARRPEAIEALGSADVLCVDKTGTLTENKMRVAELCPLRASGDAAQLLAAESLEIARELPASLPEDVHELLELAMLASAPESLDPMEQALRTLGERALRGTKHLHPDYAREQEYPLSRTLLAMTHLWRTSAAHGHVAAAKGAPEAIADLCHLGEDATRALLARAHELAARGLRVLAVARAELEAEEHPRQQHDFAFRLLGLLGFEDPVRPSVPAAVRSFADAGVRVVMITGDHLATALAIAKQAGIDTVAGAITGAAFAALDEPARRELAKRTNVFARATPDHKLAIVHALTEGGQLVAMTGDGVNDAPALRAAHAGIALGRTGTDVAREAAALVLTHEDFAVIEKAIQLGRRVLANLHKAIHFILAVHVPIAGLSVVPLLLGLPPMLFPIHVVFLELVIDPACTVALEAEQPSASTLASRQGRRLFERRAVLTSLGQGMALFLAVLASYVLCLRRGLAPEQARAAAFSALVIGNLALILVVRSSTRSALATLLASRNRAADVLSVATLVVLAVALLVPGARELFRFALPPLAVLGLSVLAAATAVLCYDIPKLLRPAAAAIER